MHDAEADRGAATLASMYPRWLPLAAGVVVLGSAATFALIGVERERGPIVGAREQAEPPTMSAETKLPPDHPPIGGASPHGAMPPASTELPAVSWTVPANWQEAASPSAFRLATYRVPGGAEMSVARAGGTTETNIERWLAQFEAAGAEKRETRAVRGLRVTVLQVSGSFNTTAAAFASARGCVTIGASSRGNAGASDRANAEWRCGR